jgi:hypothetical protein
MDQFWYQVEAGLLADDGSGNGEAAHNQEAVVLHQLAQQVYALVKRLMEEAW